MFRFIFKASPTNFFSFSLSSHGTPVKQPSHQQPAAPLAAQDRLCRGAAGHCRVHVSADATFLCPEAGAECPSRAGAPSASNEGEAVSGGVRTALCINAHCPACAGGHHPGRVELCPLKQKQTQLHMHPFSNLQTLWHINTSSSSSRERERERVRERLDHGPAALSSSS